MHRSANDRRRSMQYWIIPIPLLPCLIQLLWLPTLLPRQVVWQVSGGLVYGALLFVLLRPATSDLVDMVTESSPESKYPIWRRAVPVFGWLILLWAVEMLIGLLIWPPALLMATSIRSVYFLLGSLAGTALYAWVFSLLRGSNRRRYGY